MSLQVKSDDKSQQCPISTDMGRKVYKFEKKKKRKIKCEEHQVCHMKKCYMQKVWKVSYKWLNKYKNNFCDILEMKKALDEEKMTTGSGTTQELLVWYNFMLFLRVQQAPRFKKAMRKEEKARGTRKFTVMSCHRRLKLWSRSRI